MDDHPLTADQVQAAANAIGKYIEAFQVCALSDIKLKNPLYNPYHEGHGYNSVANLTSVAPKKKKKISTVMSEAKLILATMFVHLVAAARAKKKNRAVEFMEEVARVYAKWLALPGLGRDLDSMLCFTLKLRSLVTFDKPDAERPYARLFVDFLKCVARYAAAAAVEEKGLTINKKFVRVCFRAGFVSATGFPEEFMYELEEDSNAVVKLVAEKKKAKRAQKTPNTPAPDTNSVANGVTGDVVPPLETLESMITDL